jgi:hypothetical protein
VAKRKRRVIEVEVTQEVQASIDVVQWNYFDAEHLMPVHGGYQSVEILYEDGHNSLTTATVKIPIFKFLRLSTVMFVSMIDQNTQVTYARQLGVWSKTEIVCHRLEVDKTRITMNYQFLLEGWKIGLAPFLRRLIPKWNDQVWKEDLELKLRRQMVTDWGFRDFLGFVNDDAGQQQDQLNKEVRQLILPIRRPSDTPVNQNPLRISTPRRTAVRNL